MRQFLPEETLLQTVELDIQEFSPKSLADLRKGKYCEVDRLLADFAQCVWTETNKHVLITLNNLQIIFFFIGLTQLIDLTLHRGKLNQQRK